MLEWYLFGVIITGLCLIGIYQISEVVDFNWREREKLSAHFILNALLFPIFWTMMFYLFFLEKRLKMFSVKGWGVITLSLSFIAIAIFYMSFMERGF